MINKIAFISEYQATQTKPGDNDVMISITDGHDADLEYGWNEGDNLLRVCFHDYDGTEDWISDKYYIPFDDTRANTIREFIENYHSSNKQHSLIVHCFAGVSRSAAIAKYASDITGVNITPHPNYNRRVYSMLSGTFQQWKEKFKGQEE
jgi:predicted protein tyrosine phosphatase